MSETEKCRFTVEEMTGVWGIIPTTSTPEAADPLYDGIAVDTDEARRAVNLLIDDGADGILTNGTFGEEATLTYEEWKTYVTAVIETAKGRIPIFIGTTMQSTRETIERMKFVRDLGATGTMLGRPMWCQLSAEAMLEYYTDCANAVPELAIVIYDNPEAFKGRITAETYAKLAKIPQVVGAKYMGVDDLYHECIAAVDGGIRLLTLERDWKEAFDIYPETALAAWAGSASCGMLPCTTIRDLVMGGHDEQAKALTKRIFWSYETFFPNGSFKEFSKYNIPLEKERFNAAGYIKAGPTRPPFGLMPDSYLQGTIEAARRWNQLGDEIRNGDFDV
ncbi:hypothetical protein A9Q96_17015 [Rhodobacterales bacterium 52_120_T64]|nr:hypothetical protein A9Q96_17015 [Rhodobacterales bacterium 52_120_T64]